MIKLFIKLSLVSPLFLTFVVQAGLLTSSEYIVYTYDDVDYDITWASDVNIQRKYTSLTDYNELLEPNQGWGYAGGPDGIPSINKIFESESGVSLVDLFTDNKGTTDESDDSFIHSFSHWNTVFTEPDTSDSSEIVPGGMDLLAGNILSQWSWSAPADDSDVMAQLDEIALIDTALYSTFYIRKTVTTPVPEPSILMVFALGLIALVSNKRLFS